MTIDGVSGSSSRRDYDLDEIERQAPTAKPTKQNPVVLADARTREFIESYHDTSHFPPELFSGSAFEKKPGEYARGGQASPGHSELQRSVPDDTRKTEQSSSATVKAPSTTSTAGATKSAAGTYTDNPNEVGRTRTSPSAPEMLAAIKAQWPELSDAGARLLLAQSSFETGHWRACWNNNMGNAKEPDPNKPHMYIVPLPEAVTPAYAAQLEKSGNGHIMTDEEATKHNMAPAAKGLVRVLITQPCAGNRFKAPPTMSEGIASWVGHMKGMATKDAPMKAALESGDATTFTARLAKPFGYYTGDSGSYARGVAAHRTRLDKELGGSS